VPALTAAVDCGMTSVKFYPYLCGGSSAPHWNPDATGAFLRLRDRHGPECMARAVVEGVSLETRRIVEPLAASGLGAAEVRTTGGGAMVGAWNRVLADVLGVPVAVPSHLDAAMLAAAGAGAHPSVAAASAAMARAERRIDPDPDRHALYDDLYGRYRDVREVLERHEVYSLAGRGGRTPSGGV